MSHRRQVLLEEDEVFPVELEHVLRARDLSTVAPGLSSRDAVHVAVMEHHGVRRILTFDAAFNTVQGNGWEGRSTAEGACADGNGLSDLVWTYPGRYPSVIANSGAEMGGLPTTTPRETRRPAST